MQRCMSDNAMNKEYANNKQRAAVCHSLYKQAKKKSKASEEPEWNPDAAYTFHPN